MGARLDELFGILGSSRRGPILPYSIILDQVVQRFDRCILTQEELGSAAIAAQRRGETLWYPAELQAAELPFDPLQVGVRVAYGWDDPCQCYELAWVSVWQLPDIQKIDLWLPK